MSADVSRYLGSVRSGEIALDRSSNGTAVLSIQGEHDLSTVASLRSQIDQLISGSSAIVIDLTPATFIDSSILGVILDARRRAGEANLGFAVAHADGAAAVGRVLEITGLREELPIHPTRDEAVAEAEAGGSG